MADDVGGAKRNILLTKWGPMPVWLWAGIGLVIAWVFAKYRDTKAKAADTGPDVADTTSPGAYQEGQQVAPQFIIENNLPPSPGGSPQDPVKQAPPDTTPVITPPDTGTKPPVVVKPPAKPPAKKPPIQYKVVHNDTLSAIAKKYHTTVAALWAFNTTPGNRPAATIATLKSRGQNLLYAGETILIPQ